MARVVRARPLTRGGQRQLIVARVAPGALLARMARALCS
jgi:hypothetical protein